MSVERQIAIWALALAALLVALHLLGAIVTPFAAGIALGYLLDPVVRRLERWGLGRLAGSLLILGLFVLTLALVLGDSPVACRRAVAASATPFSGVTRGLISCTMLTCSP